MLPPFFQGHQNNGHSPQSPLARRLFSFANLDRLIDNVAGVIIGKREVIELAVIALLARGHLLLDNVPGAGKTMLARALAASLALTFRRIQLTSDLMPSDITGASLPNAKTGEFDFVAGPVFTNIFSPARSTARRGARGPRCSKAWPKPGDGGRYHVIARAAVHVIATQNPVDALRDLYFDLAILLARFCDAIGAQARGAAEAARLIPSYLTSGCAEEKDCAFAVS